MRQSQACLPEMQSKVSYSLARLADKYGAEVRLTDLLGHLAGDCAMWESRHPIMERCVAYLPDLPPAARARFLCELLHQCEDAFIFKQRASLPRAVQAVGCIHLQPILGGLHHQHVRI
jgi:hypothetical protein